MIRARAIAAATILVLAAACGGEDEAATTTTAADTTTSTASTTTAGASLGATITVSNFQFEPSAVEIAAGQKVAFSFTGGTHTASAVDGTWSSGEKSAGGNFEVTLAAPGTYAFVCQIHGSMQGTITVTG